MATWIPRARGELRSSELRELARADGREGELLERELAEETGWPLAVLVPSARVGLVLALRALDAPKGSEVLLSAFNFPPLIERIRAHWRPVMVDVSGTSACPVALHRAAGPKTGAIVATHAFGRPASMAAHRELADALGVPLIEDAAQALGAVTEASGDVSVVSFGPTKPLAGWGGGAVLCRSPVVAECIRASVLQLRPTGRASRLARGVAFELVSRFGGPVSRRPGWDPVIERWLTDPASRIRIRPWQDAPMGPVETRLIRLRLPRLQAITRSRQTRHESARSALLARGIDAWPDAEGGIGFGVLASVENAGSAARAFRREGVDAPFGELRLVGDANAFPKAAQLERTLLRVPLPIATTCQRVPKSERRSLSVPKRRD